MPIIGFRRKKRFARIGKIHLGDRVASSSGKGDHPADRPSFRCPPEVEAVYGENPTALDVMIPSLDPDEWLPVFLKRWGTGEKLMCKGDGEKATCYSEATGDWEDIACAYKECPHYPRACSEQANLQVILPMVSLAGVYQIDTGSFYGINNILDEFETFRAVVEGITGNPYAVLSATFKLTREPQKIQAPGDGNKRRSVEKAILHLRPPQINVAMAHELAARHRGHGASLAAGNPPVSGMLGSGSVDYDDDEAIAGEVLPDDGEEMPRDLVAGATPQGPDMGKRTAFVALLERAAELGKNVGAVEKSVVQSVAKDAKTFGELAGDDEADRAVDALTKMVQTWDKEAAPKSAPAQPAPTQAPASPAQTAEPAAEGSLDF